jgi:hypothetical protein
MRKNMDETGQCWALGVATQAPLRKILARIFEILARI